MNFRTGALSYPAAPAPAPPLDPRQVRPDFPILKQRVHGKPLVYLDNAATSQKPEVVLDALRDFYTVDCSNIHRGVHLLSERATTAYEAAREKVRRFLNAASTREIIFVRGTTEAINLVASTFCRQNVRAGDEIVITALEHHSNIVPWQMLCEEKNAALRVVPINDAGEIELEEFERLLNPRVKLVSVAHVSNALGTINPVQRIVQLSHAQGIPVMIDGAQAAPHRKLDVQELGCDFYAFSGHKVYGPMGIGVLYGKEDWLNSMPPYQGGGDMISSVTFEKTTYNSLPYKFEGGTPNVAGAIGMGAAIDYVEEIGLNRIEIYERDLLQYAQNALAALPGLRIIGTAREKASVLSFVIEGIHPHDAGTILDHEGIAVRTGHHCAQPVMDRYNIPATTRASLALYNTRQEIDALAAGILKVKEMFA